MSGWMEEEGGWRKKRRTYRGQGAIVEGKAVVVPSSRRSRRGDRLAAAAAWSGGGGGGGWCLWCVCDVCGWVVGWFGAPSPATLAACPAAAVAQDTARRRPPTNATHAPGTPNARTARRVLTSTTGSRAVVTTGSAGTTFFSPLSADQGGAPGPAAACDPPPS